MGEPEWYEILQAVVDAMKPYARHGLNVNVDFYSGVIYQLHGIPMDLYVPIFAIGRMPGWVIQCHRATARQHPDPAADALRRSRTAGLRADLGSLTGSADGAIRNFL